MFYLTVSFLRASDNLQYLAGYRQKVSHPIEKVMCDMLLAHRDFVDRSNDTAQRLFANAYASLRGQDGMLAKYLRVFCLVYIGLLRRDLSQAAVHSRHGLTIKVPRSAKRLFPLPDLEGKVLYQNSIEAIG